MKTKAIILSSFLFLLTVIQVKAQEKTKRFGFEFSTGASFATSEPNNVRLNPGFGFEGIFHVRVMEHAGIYGGWGWNRFGSDESFAGDDACFEETGYVFGLQFKHPVGTMPLSYYLRAGGLYNHIEVENSEGNIIYDSGHGMGLQLAGGLDFQLGSNWSFTPGLKFNLLPSEIDMEGVTKELDINYLSVRVGILKRF